MDKIKFLFNISIPVSCSIYHSVSLESTSRHSGCMSQVLASRSVSRVLLSPVSWRPVASQPCCRCCWFLLHCCCYQWVPDDPVPFSDACHIESYLQAHNSLHTQVLYSKWWLRDSDVLFILMHGTGEGVAWQTWYRHRALGTFGRKSINILPKASLWKTSSFLWKDSVKWSAWDCVFFLQVFLQGVNAPYWDDM